MSALIKQLREFSGIHKGEKIVVCGCGMSLLEFKDHHQDFITIGVNDVGALFSPTYLMVTDHSGRFAANTRRRTVYQSGAKYLFTCAKGWWGKNLVHFELGSRSLNNLDSPDRIDHYLNSPYAAVNLAYKMGAKHIGLIGVDFTDGHFYNPKDGKHPLIKSNYLAKVNSAYQILSSELEKRGTSLVNLSESSKVTLRKITLEEFRKL
jgi:hypothetical protein